MIPRAPSAFCLYCTRRAEDSYFWLARLLGGCVLLVKMDCSKGAGRRSKTFGSVISGLDSYLVGRVFVE
jgi:hypothetical protein